MKSVRVLASGHHGGAIDMPVPDGWDADRWREWMTRYCIQRAHSYRIDTLKSFTQPELREAFKVAQHCLYHDDGYTLQDRNKSPEVEDWSTDWQIRVIEAARLLTGR